MNYRDNNSRPRTRSSSGNARNRIMSPQEKAKRDELLEKRERLHQKQRAESTPGKVRTPKGAVKKRKSFVIEKFHVWSIILGLIIVLMSVNLLTFVQGIQVKNNENASSKDIITWATEDALSFNGLYLWYKINHREIEYPVSIVDAKVTFQNPWTLTLRVTEKEILGGVVLSDRYAYFDQEGQVLLITRTIQEGISLVKGFEVTEPVLYEPLTTDNQEGFANLLEVMALIKKYQVQVDEIIPQNDNGISIIIGDTTILLGTNNYEAKVPHIEPILESLEEKDGTLYLEKFDGDNGTITFK